MSFPSHDRTWTGVADFISTRALPGDSVLAPDLFRHLFPGICSYLDTFRRPGVGYDWAIVHKGELGSLSRPALELAAQGRAVFANEVFVVWHRGDRSAAIDSRSPHLRAFHARLAEHDKAGAPHTPPAAARPVLPERGPGARTLTDMLFEIALEKGRYSDPLSLIPSQAQVYSQNGEDGIVAEIFGRIGARDRYFVEIGIENGLQNNTRLLLEQGWRGIWIDGSSEGVALARATFDEAVRSGALTVVEALVTRHNVDAVLDSAQAPPRFDFLSLDVDQNTGHLWASLRRRSRVACIEYNANLPPSLALEAEYHPELAWDGTSWYGASLKALEQIAGAKDMSLVGCELIGVNAFFVGTDEASGKFRAPFTAEEHYEPPRFGRSSAGGTGLGHPPSPRARRWSRP